MPYWKGSEKLSHSVLFKLLSVFYLFDYFHCVESISDCAFCADVWCAETVFCPFHQICLRRMTAVNWQTNFLAIEKHVIQYVSTVNSIAQVFLVIYISCLISTGIVLLKRDKYLSVSAASNSVWCMHACITTYPWKETKIYSIQESYLIKFSDSRPKLQMKVLLNDPWVNREASKPCSIRNMESDPNTFRMNRGFPALSTHWESSLQTARCTPREET